MILSRHGTASNPDRTHVHGRDYNPGLPTTRECCPIRPHNHQCSSVSHGLASLEWLDIQGPQHSYPSSPFQGGSETKLNKTRAQTTQPPGIGPKNRPYQSHQARVNVRDPYHPTNTPNPPKHTAPNSNPSSCAIQWHGVGIGISGYNTMLLHTSTTAATHSPPISHHQSASISILLLVTCPPPLPPTCSNRSGIIKSLVRAHHCH